VELQQSVRLVLAVVLYMPVGICLKASKPEQYKKNKINIGPCRAWNIYSVVLCDDSSMRSWR
jgi:hypothetical protein